MSSGYNTPILDAKGKAQFGRMAGWPKTPDHSFSHADDAAPAAAFLFLLFFFIKRSAYRYAGQPLATTKSGRGRAPFS